MERLPKPATAKGKSSTLRDGAAGGGSGGGGGAIALRYSARAAGSQQIDGEGRRLPTRTSLERLPRPRAAAPAALSTSTPPRRGGRGSESSHSRANAELNALRGLDAAVSEVSGGVLWQHWDRYDRRTTDRRARCPRTVSHILKSKIKIFEFRPCFY